MSKILDYFILFMIGAAGTLPLAIDYHLGHRFTFFGVATFIATSVVVGMLSAINAQKR